MLIMNVENDQPYQSLSGIISLTNLLPELPLPTPSQNAFSSQSLLYDPRLSEEAHTLLNMDDDTLVHSLSIAMASTNTDNIDFKENFATDAVDHSALPPLLKAIVDRNDNVFRNKQGFQGIFQQPNYMNWENIHNSHVNYNGMNYSINSQNGYALSDVMTPSPDQPKAVANCESTDKALEELHYSFPELQFTSSHMIYDKVTLVKCENIEKESKYSDFLPRKDKEERRDFEKKKKKKKKHKHSRHSNHDESSQYSIVKSNPDSQKLVLSLIKSPEGETSKHKKKKRKNREKHHLHKSKNDCDHSNEKIEPIKLNIKLSSNGDNAQIISSTITLDEIVEKCSPMSETPEIETLRPSSRNETNIISQNMEQSSPISSKQFVTSTPAGFGTPSTTIDRISQCSTSSLIIPSSQEPDHHLWNCSIYPTKSDDQFELIIPLDITGTKEYLFNDIMGGEDLLSPLNLNITNNSMLNSVLRESVNEPFLMDEFDNTALENRSSMREPGGLASYFSSSNKEQSEMVITQEKETIVKQKSISDETIKSLRYKKQKKKKKNELDGLKTWFIGAAPVKESGTDISETVITQESAWDKTIGSFSHSISDKVRKRKRTTRQPAQNSAFVFEHDEEYSAATNASNHDDESDGGCEIVSKRSLRNTSTNYIGMDDIGESGDESSAPKSKRKKKDDDEPFEIKLKDPNEIKYPHLKKSQETARRRRERVVALTKLSNTTKKIHLPSDMLDPSLITESTTYQHFVTSIDNCLEAVADIDLVKTMKDQVDSDTTISIPSDVLISREQLQSMSSDVAKLKATSSTKDVPVEKLSRINTLLMLNIKSGSRVCLPVSGSETDETQNRLYRELAIERIGRSLDSSYIAVNIMTSPDMSKEVFIEDTIEALVSCVKYQLTNLIFPEYDPAYRAVNTAKDNQMSIKWKRAREKETTKSKSIIYFYNRIVDIISNLSELVLIQGLTDSVILQLSNIGVSVFFVENINEIQLVSLRLITVIFSKYEKHRNLIMDDILASLSRLPSSKKNLRNYRLNSEESIQMLTALSLLLVQSVVNISAIEDSDDSNKEPPDIAVKEVKLDREALLEQSYNNALHTALHFLNSFLNKSTTKGEDDYKAIFENFITDLLLTVNKPEWPAAEVMLNILASLLMKHFTNKQCDQVTRVTCIDYMGNVAATLRRDAVSSTLNDSDIDNIIKDLIRGCKSSDEEDEDDEDDEKMEDTSDDRNSKNDLLLKNVDKVQILRDAILNYLDSDKFDLTSKFARQFYFSKWFSECMKEMRPASNSHNPDNPKEKSKNIANDVSTFQVAEDRRKYLMFKMFGTLPNDPVKRILKNKSNKNKSVDDEQNRYDFKLKGSLDYEDACLVCRFLASLKPLSQSFDVYLKMISKLLSDNSVAIRTKAMRCLSAVVEADPSILSRKDVENAVHQRFLDSSTSVREAAVELVGKYLLTRPQLISQYYPMISERILDKGTSVRKRVIRIFRDICIENSEFPKIPEICVKMIRRINDEESIKKLVNEVFQNMWFSPVKEKEAVKLLQKVMNITDVVSSCSEIGYEWFDQLLESLLKKDDNEKIKIVEKACKQIVDCLVQNIMRLEEISNHSNNRLVSCLATLHLFTKIRPELMIQHAMTLQPYLSIRKTNENDIYIIHYVTRILEASVPLIEHPAEHFINQLEIDMVTLMMTHGKMVLESCVACLAATVNKISYNYVLVKECFDKFFVYLTKYKAERCQSKNVPTVKGFIHRALFAVGLLCKHFDFNCLELDSDINNRIFETLMYFAEDNSLSCDIRTKALSGIGFLCVRHRDFLCSQRLSTFYHRILLNKMEEVNVHDYPELICCVLDNISLFLAEEDRRMRTHDSLWKNNEKKESLKEMGDMSSGVSSHVAQTYLNAILDNMLQPWVSVRLKAVSTISVIIRQGLINPITSVPYLICAQTDPHSAIRVKADNELAEIDKKFVGFISMKAVHGIKLSCQMQEILMLYDDAEYRNNWCKIQKKMSPVIVRGILDPNVDIPLSLNHNLYSMLRSSKQNRRAFLYALLAIFDVVKSRLSLLIYVSDNLAQFPYQSQEEPLYLVHQIDILVSSHGPTFIQQIKEVLYPELVKDFNDSSVVNNKRIDAIRFDDEDNPDVLYQRLMDNIGSLQKVRESIRNSSGCVLLIALKQYLRELYSLTDAKVQKYSPSDTGKAWERQLTRRSGVRFDPVASLNLNEEAIAQENIYQRFLCDNKSDDINLDADLYPNEGYLLIQKFLHLRQLVLSLDTLDIIGDSDEETAPNQSRSKAAAQNKSETPSADGVNPTQIDEITGNPIIKNAPTYQSAVMQGRTLRVEVDRLDLNTIPHLVPKQRFHHKKTLVPKQPNSSSDEDSDDVHKERRCHLSVNNRKSNLSKVPMISRPSRKAKTKIRPIRIKSSGNGSSDDSFEEEDNIDSDPDFTG